MKNINCVSLTLEKWHLFSNDSQVTMSAEMCLSDIFAQICDHYNIPKELVPHQNHVGVWIDWDRETGHVSKKEDISHHGSPIWEEFASYDLSEKENQILLKMNELIDILEGLSDGENNMDR